MEMKKEPIENELLIIIEKTIELMIYLLKTIVIYWQLWYHKIQLHDIMYMVLCELKD